MVVPAGVPSKTGMAQHDLFTVNAGTITDACCEVFPTTFLPIIPNPVNSTVPIAAEVFKLKGWYDPKRIMGGHELGHHPRSYITSEMKGGPGPKRISGGKLIRKISKNWTLRMPSAEHFVIFPFDSGV